MIFSATVPKFIQNMAAQSMTNPVLIDLVGDDENQLPAQLRTKAIITSSFENKVAHIHQYLTQNQDKKIIIFCETKKDVQRFESMEFARFLGIHGDLEQGQRERALAKFKEPGSRYVLVGTDVAARGLDVEDIDVVIQLGCKQLDSFVHRSGRTARKGKDGLNILFFEKDDMKFVLDLEKELNINVQLANQIDDTEEVSSSDEEATSRYGKFVHKLHNNAHDTMMHKQMRIDNSVSSQIYKALSCPNLDNSHRQKYVKFLIDYYVSKTHLMVEPVGFLTGKQNHETYGLAGLPQKQGQVIKD